MRNNEEFYKIIEGKIQTLIFAYNAKLAPGVDFEVFYTSYMNLWVIRYMKHADLNNNIFQKAFRQTLLENGISIGYCFIEADPEIKKTDKSKLNFNELHL